MEQLKSPWIRGTIHVLLIFWVIYSIFPFMMSMLTSTMIVRDVIARDPKFVPQWLVDNNLVIAIVIVLVMVGIYFLMGFINANVSASPLKRDSMGTSSSPMNPLGLTVLAVAVLVVCGSFLWFTSVVGEDQIFQPTIQAYQGLWLNDEDAIAAFGPVGSGLVVLAITLVGAGIFATLAQPNQLMRYIGLGMTVAAVLFASQQIVAVIGDVRLDDTFLMPNAESAVFVPDWVGILVVIAVGALVVLSVWNAQDGRRATYFGILFVIIGVIIGLPQIIEFAVFYEYFLNTVVVTVCTVAISISIGCLAAYALARYRGITGFLILITALGFRALPRLAFILPYYYFANLTGLFDTHLLLIIAFVTINQPFTIWMLRSFFMDIPKEIEESAMIDGCNRLTAFTRVIIPIVWPGIITTALFSMLLAYNEFLLASILTSTVQTLPVAMSQYTSGETLRVLPTLHASSVSIVIPIIIIIIFFQRYLIKGLAGGAVKG